MRRMKSILVVTLVMSVGALTMLYAYTRAQNANRQVRRPTEATQTNTGEKTARKGKALVKHLPDDVEGVELKDGAVHLKDGYKFVKSDGKVIVARINGNNATGTWACRCVGESTSGSCEEEIESASLFCNSGTCTGTCKLSVVVKNTATAIYAY